MWRACSGHVWIGYNGATLTRRQAEEIAVDQPGQRHYLHLYDPSASLVDVFCPLPNGRLLWRPSAFLPAARGTVRQVYRDPTDVEVPLIYAALCWGFVTEDGVFVVPKIGDGARAWAHRASGGLRIREIPFARWPPTLSP